MKTAFKAKIIIEYKTDKYLVASSTEPNYEAVGRMIADGAIEKVEWIFDWLQNGNEPIIILTEKI